MHAADDHPSAGCDPEALNTLLRGELAAVETYDQAMDRFADEHILADLQKIREEHARAVVFLEEQIIRSGGAPAAGPGPWGAFAAVVTGAPPAIGPATALAALRQGEEHGINEYEDALRHADVDPECKDIIRTRLLPHGRAHVEELNRLMGGMG